VDDYRQCEKILEKSLKEIPIEERNIEYDSQSLLLFNFFKERNQLHRQNMDEFVLPAIISEQCNEFMDIDPNIMYVIEISIIKL